mgnify:CR=1 FL=1
MAKVITPVGEMKFLECHRGQNIVTSNEGTIMVHDPDKETVFIVCMDDSKSCGYRKFDEKHNTVKAAREYIDWLKAARN